MPSFAQTNIQLFNQLRRDGYSNTDLGCIFNAYQLATQLFTGYFRGDGKTFIAHLVGTASILASLGASVEVVGAGILHAAYMSGDFGDGNKGISESRREQVKRAVGDKIEEYVAQYTALKWNEQIIKDIRDRARTDKALSQIESDVLLMRLANELEDHLDLGILYCANVEKRQQYVNLSGHNIIDIALALGFPTLAAELSQVFQAINSTEIPSEIRTDSNYSYLVPPRSYRMRILVMFRYWLIRGFRYLRSAVSRLYQSELQL